MLSAAAHSQHRLTGRQEAHLQKLGLGTPPPNQNYPYSKRASNVPYFPAPLCPGGRGHVSVHICGRHNWLGSGEWQIQPPPRSDLSQQVDRLRGAIGKKEGRDEIPRGGVGEVVTGNKDCGYRDFGVGEAGNHVSVEVRYLDEKGGIFLERPPALIFVKNRFNNIQS